MERFRDLFINGSRIRRRTSLHARFIVCSGTLNHRIKRSEKKEQETMHLFIQLKNATPLIVIAGAIVFIGSIVTATAPEGINPDVGNDVLSIPRAAVADFNGDGHPDLILRNPGTRQTAIWYLNNNVYQGGALGPTIAAGWVLEDAADFNRDLHPDYALWNRTTDRTTIWYMSGPKFLRGAYGPTIPSGWALVAVADFNGDGHPDYLLYNPASRRTAIWYLNNNVFTDGRFGPTLPAGWSLLGP